MDLQERKARILRGILLSMSEYVFNRGLQINGEGNVVGFQTYQQFVQHQRNLIDQFNESSIQTLEAVEQIVKNAEVLDEESMITMDAGGFCFNSRNQFVFIQSR